MIWLRTSSRLFSADEPAQHALRNGRRTHGTKLHLAGTGPKRAGDEAVNSAHGGVEHHYCRERYVEPHPMRRRISERAALHFVQFA